MNVWTSIFNQQNAVSGVFGAVFSFGAFAYAYNQDSVDSAVSEAGAVTALQEQLVSQQRQLDAAERRHSASLLDVKKQQEQLRREALVQGSERNRVMMGLLEDRLDKRLLELSKQLEELPTFSGGGIDPAALERMVAQVKRDVTIEMETRLASMPRETVTGISRTEAEQMFRGVETNVLTRIAPLIDEKLAAIPASSGDGIPVATKRRIHFVEKDCVHLPSMPKQFTLKFKRGQEFCWKPSVLWFDIPNLLAHGGFNFRFVGGNTYTCSSGKTCYIGSEDDGTRFKVRVENGYESEGVFYSEVNFQKIE